jgi:hypothetical protein
MKVPEIHRPELAGVDGLIAEARDSIGRDATHIGLPDVATRRLTTPQLLLRTGAAVGALSVFGLGVAEGYVRSHDPGYAIAYGITHMGPSIVWARIPPEMVAQLFHISTGVIRDLNAEVIARTITESRAALESVTMDWLYAVRGGIAGSVVLGSIVSGISQLRTAGENLKSRILEGREPIKLGNETLFFLGGEESGPMEALTSSGVRILPIVENSDAVTGLLNLVSAKKRGERPFFILVPNGDYTKVNISEKIKIASDALIKTQQGKRLLVVVGDGSVHEEEFPFVAEPMQDLTIKELQMTTEDLELAAKNQNVAIDETVRVYIGDADLRTQTGSGKHELTLRQEMNKYKSLEVFIDSKAPLIQGVLDWLGKNKVVVFHTKNQAYFQTAKALLKGHGVKVYDQEDKNIPNGTPVLVYERTTAESIQRSVEVKRVVKHDKVAALTSTIAGHILAEQKNITDICSATIYRDILLKVVTRLKEGESAADIQDTLDELWNYPGLDIQRVGTSSAN